MAQRAIFVPGNPAFASASHNAAFEGGEAPRYLRKTSGFLRFRTNGRTTGHGISRKTSGFIGFGSSAAPGAGFPGKMDLPKNIWFSQGPGLVEEPSATIFPAKAQVLSGSASTAVSGGALTGG
jgi:hypothetical protein